MAFIFRIVFPNPIPPLLDIVSYTYEAKSHFEVVKTTLIKNKIKFSSFIRRFNWERLQLFPIYVIYSNTLVHSSPHLPVYWMGRWVRLHCFFSNGNIKYDTTFYA